MNDLKTVLVVEDDFASRQYLLLLLKKLNFSSIAAETGEEALTIMKDKNADIFLLDIALGAGIDGLELGAKLREEERFANTPMVAVTAFTRDKLSTLDDVGFCDYLAKPYTFDQLMQLLKKYID